jgi:UDP-N-acetylmuramoyl-L-alanyl-D-glutamate--2,6-diaminopimelate ligase
MGRAAGELCDEVILSSDNPRSEDPDLILQDILQGVQRSGNKHVHAIPDRKEAIAYAVRLAQSGDVLVLAGKGHENYQILGGQKLHFDEREILREILSA